MYSHIELVFNGSWETNDQSRYCRSSDITFFFYSTHSSSFSKPNAYITHNATSPLSDIVGGHLLDDMQLPLETKRLHTSFSHMQLHSPRPVNRLKCVKLAALPFKWLWLLVPMCDITLYDLCDPWEQFSSSNMFIPSTRRPLLISQPCCLTRDAEGGMWCCSGQSQLAGSGVIDLSVKLIGIIFLFCFVLPREVLTPPSPPLTWHAPFVTPTQWRQISSGSISADLGGHKPVSLQMYLCRISFEVSRAAWVHYFFSSFCRFLLIDRVGFAEDVIILLILPYF